MSSTPLAHAAPGNTLQSQYGKVTRQSTLCSKFSKRRRNLKDTNHIELIRNYIVNKGNWLWVPVNIKAANKEAKMEVGRSTTVHLFCFSLIHYAWIDRIAMFSLACCMDTRNVLLYFPRFCARSTPKIANKNRQQIKELFPGFITIYLHKPWK